MADAGGGGGGGVLEPVPSLRTEVESLKRERDRLQDALMRAMRSAVLFRGYLHQHQTEDESIGLLKADWEMQWFVLGSGGLLKIYDSDRDEAREPGALLYIADCLVEVEPPGVERPWCMRIVERAATSQAHAGGDGGGGGGGLGLPLPSVNSWGSVSISGRNELLLVAADSAAALMQWSDAFGRAGLKVVWPSAGLGRGSSRGGSGAGGGAGGSFSLGGARTNSAPLLGAAADAAAAAAHSGLVTLGLVVLATTHIRALLENLLVYRLRLTLLNKSVWLAIVNTAGDNAACLLAVPGLLVFAAASLGVEWLALALLRREQREDSALGKKLDDITTTPSAADDDASPFVDDQSGRAMRRLRAHRHELVVVPLAVANCVLSLLLPCMLVFRLEAHPFPALLLTLSALVIQMKLMSYHHHNWHLRTIRRRRGPGARAPGERGGGGGDEVEAPWCALAYPENLTVNNMLFFLAVPTLTYQVNYPLLPNRRPRMLLRWVLMLLALASLQLLMIDQLLVPAMLSGLKPLADLDWWHFCERVLGLALPNLYVWLLTFVIVFHVWLNIMGEITRFADRCFYKAWWNASSLDQFWRLWNMPVHTFLMRTIYFPLIRMRVNKWWAVVCVFFWSAVMHEVAVGVPFRILRGWAFWAMFGQIPLITLTAYLRARLKNDALGNAIFWVSFCILGQPICVLLYAHEYLKREQPPVAAHAI
ncbi:diacylglycerol acyltransferase [Monoraphidium neglectum]|uniref:diacylglycerol O-acyltransferase n=1 Tax=Monoraphidium neglectum TaxID=145388 RepID=A0A0D2K985_9CHLO|nr:diacylglycerol acyltransferase [Monoraphidium neglectum]KIZ06773.1 diacylglycerol acyltransferase [Monoraphidium neglectum]|eukprot:XP_013905792.1 diacylglycerol acyltransferase [Monoraphidium neglectum]